MKGPRVQFGVLNPGDDAASTIKAAVRAEELGYASFFVGHHRFTPGFGYTQHPWIVLSAVAALTSEIRLGTSIFLLPLSHPLDVAEEVASLDVISKGRVIFGAGLGYRQYEYDAVGLPYRRRGALMSECLEVVQKVWESEHVSHAGEFFTFDDVTLTPRPIQQPRPPIWIGANSDTAMRRASRLADGWLAGFSDRLPKLAPKLDEYRRLATENGRSSTVALMRMVGIGATRAYVEENWLPDVLGMLRNYVRVQAPAERGDAQADKMRAAGSGKIGIEELGNDVFVAGTPQDCIAAVRRGVDETQCDVMLLSFGGPDKLAAMEIFAREVMPAFV
ncbi:MAG: LLM class flavin-dependent oxidoreductase [Acidimicrobiia bacterium]